jgi:Domain of unknown function (DUF4129)
VRIGVVLLAALVAGVAAPVAGAEPADGAEVRRLAERAAGGDERALERLRRIDRVGGRAVDLRRALEGASREELRERLDALGDETPAGEADPAAARAAAEKILAQRRFGESGTPRPLRRVLEWIGDQLEPGTRRISSAADRAPGGPLWFWLALAAAFVVAVTLISFRVARRRAAAVEAVATSRTRVGRERPAELERAADEAERGGDWERAVRLRFRAGLLRLDEARVLPFRESITSGEVARKLRSREFEGVARAFDEVVYGRRAARPDDAAGAREGWRRVLAEVRPA